jgi:hypothetical protein
MLNTCHPCPQSTFTDPTKLKKLITKIMNKTIFKRLFCDNEWRKLENVKNYQSHQRVITLKSNQVHLQALENSNSFLECSEIKIIHAIILAEKSATQLPQKVHKIVQQFSDR